jgi:hypothetical protein
MHIKKLQLNFCSHIMNQSILTSRDVMAMLDICENTLLKLERNGKIKVDFRISNRKRYLKENILNSLKRL